MGAVTKKRKRLLPSLLAVCMAVSCVIAQTPAQTARAAEAGKIGIILDNVTGGYAEDAAGGKVLVCTTKTGTYVEIDGSGGFREANSSITEVGTDNGKLKYTIAESTLYLKLEPKTGNSAKVNLPGGTAPEPDGDGIYTLTAGSDGQDYHVEFSNAAPGPEPGEGGQGRTAAEGEAMSVMMSLVDGTNFVDFTVFLFYDDGTQNNNQTMIGLLESNPGVGGSNFAELDLGKITGEKIGGIVFRGNLVSEGKLKLYSVDSHDSNKKELTGEIPVVSKGTSDVDEDGVLESLYETADGAVKVMVDPANPASGSEPASVERTSVEFTHFMSAGAPFQFRTDYSSPNYAKYGLEFMPYATVVKDKGQEFADETFKALAAGQDEKVNENELAVIKAVPSFYLASFCLYKSEFRGIRISTGRMPSMYDFTTPDVVPLENSPSTKADEVTAFYGEEKILFEPVLDAGDPEQRDQAKAIKKIELATVNGVTIPAAAVKINDDNTVTVRSGFFSKIPLKVTLEDDTAGYVLVNRIGIDITTGSAGDVDGGWKPLHGAAQSGAVLEDTATEKYSTARNLVATFYFNKGEDPEPTMSYKDFDLVATLTYPDGSKEVRTVKGYGEVECDSQWGPNGIMGGDYLIWSSAKDTGAAPVSVSVTAVRASGGSAKAFAGAMFGNGAGVTKDNLNFGPTEEEKEGR